MLGHINLSIQTLLAPGFEDEQHTDNHPQMDTHTHSVPLRLQVLIAFHAS